MTDPELLLRQINVRLTLEEFDAVKGMAANEMRRLGNMARLLIREALAARGAQVGAHPGPDPLRPRPKSGERKRVAAR